MYGVYGLVSNDKVMCLYTTRDEHIAYCLWLGTPNATCVVDMSTGEVLYGGD